MKRLEAWIARRQRQSARIPRLEDALLGRRPIAYIAHRLRFVTLRVVLRTMLHIVEVVALAQVFSPRYLGPILLLRHSTLLISSLYWGALEAQRIALRDARRRHADSEFAHIINRWAAAAVIAIVFVQLLAAGFLCFAPREFPDLTIYDAYAIACGLRLGLDIWSRTKHSAVFAVARVRRPLPSLVLIDLFEVFGLLIAWLQIGAFAFALMLIVTGVLRASMTLWFVSSTSEQLRLPRPARSLWREFSRGGLRRLPWRQALKFSLLNASLQIDSLAIVLLSSGVAGDDGVRLSLSMHAFSPLLGAGFAWTRVFYFDFVRLGAYVCPLVTERFGRLLDRVAVLYPFVLVALVLPIAAWLVPGLLATTPILLVGFVVARSLFALRQMEAYSYADHRVQLGQGAVLLLALAVTLLLAHRINAMLAGFTAALLLAAVMARRARVKRSAPEAGEALCFEQFVVWLRQQSTSVCLALLEVDRRVTSVGRVRLALLQKGFEGPNLQPSQHRLLVALPSPIEPRELRVRIMTATAGTVTSMRLGAMVSSGIEACAQLHEGGAFGDLHGDVRQSHPVLAAHRLGIDALVTEFVRQFPDGVRLTGSEGRIRSLSAAARGELQAVLSAINGNRFRRGRRSRYIEVATYRTNGEVTQLFLLPHASPRSREFAAFRQRVADASRLASLQES